MKDYVDVEEDQDEEDSESELEVCLMDLRNQGVSMPLRNQVIHNQLTHENNITNMNSYKLVQYLNKSLKKSIDKYATQTNPLK